MSDDNVKDQRTPEQRKADGAEAARKLGFESTGPTPLPERAPAGSPKLQQVPSVGRVVHFVYGDKHYAAIITEPDWHGGGEQSLAIFPPQSAPFYDVAPYSAENKPGTWHWPEYVPAKG